MKGVKLTLSIILLAAVIVFSLQNTEIVSVRFLVWELSLSRALMIFAVLLIGILVGWAGKGLGKRK